MRLCLILCGILATSCNYNHVKGLVETPVSQDQLMYPDYKTVETLVMGPKCLQCHSNAGGNRGGLNLEGYQQVRKWLAQIVYHCFEKKDMPPRGGLSPEQSLLLRNWTDAGAPEEIKGGDDRPDPTLESGPVNWVKVRDKILARRCLDCHAEPNPQAGLDLSSLPAVKAHAESIFARVIVKQDMPPQPYPVVSPRERRVLLKWFDAGMPE